MKNRIFFLSAIVAAIIALGLHAVSREFSVKSTSIHAQMWNRNAVEKQEMKIQADHCASLATVLFYTGLVFTFSSIFCLVVARFRKESGWYLIVILLLFFDFIMQRLL
jgi:VIT1/CCC1 family predicted Fe2+/Mn2+ transporter